MGANEMMNVLGAVASRSAPAVLRPVWKYSPGLRLAMQRSFQSAPVLRESVKQANNKIKRDYVKERTPIELFKFSLFVSVPIIMMLHFRYPDNLNRYIMMFQYVTYPAELDKANAKKKLESSRHEALTK